MFFKPHHRIYFGNFACGAKKKKAPQGIDAFTTASNYKKTIMLRKIRTALAAVFFTLITLLFLDFTGTLHAWLGWMARIQFLPAVLAANLVVVALLVILTLVFGRIYCSVICPLGVMQDIISHIHGRVRPGRFSYSREKRWLRYSVLAVFVIALLAGCGALVALLAPYSAYGRIAGSILQPIYLAANNILAGIAERMGSYAFYSVDIWMKSLPTLIVAAVTLAAVGILAWRGGRTYCNTICPVGSVLGILSRFSLLKIRIDDEKCVSCGLCSRNCKASAIDLKSHKIDYSRCVACGDCLEKCRKNALSYCGPGHGKKEDRQENTTDTARRSFLLGTSIAATTALMAQEKKKVDGGLAAIEDKVAPQRATPVTPPGALSASHFAKHCTACQLCVSACPNGVLRPSTSLDSFMQPVMSYERGYCRPECNRCAEVCPSGAIKPISLEEKSSTQIGHAVWIRKNCIPVADGVSCGNCARHCPAGAIMMVPMDRNDPDSLKIPAVNTSMCIGCGACENLCPARPLSAIYVEGHEAHKLI